MVVCLTGARFNMKADVLRWEGVREGGVVDETSDPEIVWSSYQDPITGEILNKWVPGEADDPSTPTVDESTLVTTIPCMARGIVDGGIRVAGTTERFGDTYENIDFVKLWTPAHVRLSKRDQVTNIRNKQGIVWLNEEGFGTPPTVFNVNGVTPLFDAFNKHIENFVLLERTDSNA